MTPSQAPLLHETDGSCPGLMPRLAPFVQSFRCPECHCSATLTPAETSLRCSGCNTHFRIEGGCPILLNKASAAACQKELDTEYGRAMNQEYEHIQNQAQPAPADGRQPLVAKIKTIAFNVLKPPEIMLHYNPRLTKNSGTWSLFTHQGQNTKVLNLGGGPTRYSNTEVTLNIRPFHNVDCVGDGHNIPFADNTFDSVICNAVLEHVHSPEQMAREMIRVLKPGGQLYAEVPFIFFFHGYPNDFRRYTIEGMRYLFADLGKADFGMTHGPISALLQSTNCLIDIVLPARLPKLKKCINGLYRWCFFLLKYLDLALKNNKRAHQIAGGFWVLGTKTRSKTSHPQDEPAYVQRTQPSTIRSVQPRRDPNDSPVPA